MPDTRKGESRNHYINRCVPIVMKENGGNQKAAIGKCEGMYDSHWKAKKKSKGSFIKPQEIPVEDGRQEINDFIIDIE